MSHILNDIKNGYTNEEINLNDIRLSYDFENFIKSKIETLSISNIPNNSNEVVNNNEICTISNNTCPKKNNSINIQLYSNINDIDVLYEKTIDDINELFE